jgi:hypothetical protein
MIVLTIITIRILCEASANATRRHRVDVWDHTGVCLRHVKVKLHITAVQIERRFCSSSTVSLDAPTAILDVHRISIGHDEVTSAGAVQVC